MPTIESWSIKNNNLRKELIILELKSSVSILSWFQCTQLLFYAVQRGFEEDNHSASGTRYISHTVAEVNVCCSSNGLWVLFYPDRHFCTPIRHFLYGRRLLASVLIFTVDLVISLVRIHCTKYCSLSQAGDTFFESKGLVKAAYSDRM